MHRFLQPDNYVQDPYNSQNYNRYGYVLNNPLKYTDPTGELADLAAAIIIGAILSATTYTVTAIANDSFSAQGLIKATFIGALSSAVTFGIGEVASSIAQFGVRLTFQTLALRYFSGHDEWCARRKFLDRFCQWSISSMAGSLTGGSGYKNADGKFTQQTHGLNGLMGGGDSGMIFFSTFTGGAAAQLTGGNFWQGASTALMVSGLNHAMHGIDPRAKKVAPKKQKYAKWQRDGQKVIEKIDGFFEKYIYAEGTAVLKAGSYVDVGLKHVGRVSVGQYKERGVFWSNQDGLNTNSAGNKFVVGGAYEAGGQYTYDIKTDQSSLSLGYGLFAVDVSNQSTFIGINFNVSAGIGVGDETGFKPGLKFIMKISSKTTWFFKKVIPIIIVINLTALLLINYFFNFSERFFLSVIAINIVLFVGWIFNGKNLKNVDLGKDFFIANHEKILFDDIISIQYKNLSHLIKVVYKDENFLKSFTFIPNTVPFIIPNYIKKINASISKRV